MHRQVLKRLAQVIQARSWLSMSGLVAALALLLIVFFHEQASTDRLLMNLYYVAIVAAAYALVRRRALALMVFVVVVAAGTTLGAVYFSPKLDPGDPLLSPVVDLTSWCAILLLSWRLTHHAYVIETEERRAKARREIEQKAFAMRAAALTCTSHELRTPLAGILSFTEMLNDGSSGELTELQRDFVGEIEKCGQYLLTLVNDILDYAKVQAGQVRLARETVALPELIEQCVALVQVKAAHQGMRITTQLDPDVPEVFADPLRLKQIILNLLSNAVKYSPENGLVRIQTRQKAGTIFIGIRDTGRGMTPEQVTHLFDPYYQAAAHDQRIGTGLGLGIAKLLAELHGGAITVESAPEAGSLFTICLPADATAADSDQTNQEPGAKTWLYATEKDQSKSPEFCESAA